MLSIFQPKLNRYPGFTLWREHNSYSFCKSWRTVKAYVLVSFFLLLVGTNRSEESSSSDFFVPIVLSSAGLNNSFFSSELVLTNRGMVNTTIRFTYTAAFGGGGGTASDQLVAGQQRIIPDAIVYLRSIGVPVPGTGDRGGTLRISFSNLSSSSEAAVTVRTTTSAPGGRAGLAYEGIPIAKLLTGPAYLCGLRQTEKDRSNLAIQNAGAEGETDVVIRLTVFSGNPTAPFSKVLPDERLAPGEFRQISGILQSNGLSLTNGFVRVERVSGSAPYYAYAVINDQASSDGSFVPPVLESSLVGLSGLTLPAIVEANTFTSEVILTNWSTSDKRVKLTYMADAVQSSDRKAVVSRTIQAGEQLVIPNLIQFFRESGLTGLLPFGFTYSGPLLVTVEEGDVSSLYVGARTSTSSGIGRYGLFCAGVPFGTSSTTSAWLYGLQQDAENRTNLALVTTASTDESANVFSIDLYDGSSGLRVNTLEAITVKAREWKQIGSILAQHAPGTTQGYAQVRRTSGSNRFIAYAVINDGGRPGERTGDGAFITSVFPAPPPSSSLLIGPRENLLTKDAIQARGLCYWPDGVMGVLRSGNTHTFFGNSGGGCASPDGLPSKTIGTLTNPIASSVSQTIPILNMKHSYHYAGGGPVYKDPASGTLLMFYHAEKWPGGDFRRFWSLLGMAKSADDGASWADLGEIISPSTPFSETGTSSYDVSSGSFVIVGSYFYVYFNDRSAADGYFRTAVARARVSEVLNAALNQNDVVPWKKYYNGDWNEPGLGGRSSFIEPDRSGAEGEVVSYNHYLRKYIMVYPGWTPQTGNDLYYAESADGVSWSSRQRIESESGSSIYPSIVGLGEEPRDSGAQFYIYYMYRTGSDYVLARRLMSFSGG